MKLALSQSYFFPYIGYFQLINAVDKFILYDWVNYIKRGWIDRNRVIILPSGETYIKIPVKKRSSNKLIKDLAICNEYPWKEKIVKQLKYNYARYPFYKDIFPFFEYLLNTTNSQRLTDFNFKTITAIARLLEIKTSITIAGDKYSALENDLKTKQESYDIKTRRIIAICKQENAETYINAIGGQSLYSKEIFQKEGINLFFIRKQVYQEKTNKIPDLSIMDVLFRFGIKETKKLLNCFDLIGD